MGSFALVHIKLLDIQTKSALSVFVANVKNCLN